MTDVFVIGAGPAGVLAAVRGRTAVHPRMAPERAATYDTIGQELSHHDVIGYVAGQGAGGTFRRISVGMLQPRVGVARTRSGYYADRDQTGESASSYSGPIVR